MCTQPATEPQPAQFLKMVLDPSPPPLGLCVENDVHGRLSRRLSALYLYLYVYIYIYIPWTSFSTHKPLISRTGLILLIPHGWYEIG